VRQWLLVSALLHLSLGNLALVLCNYAFHPFSCTGSQSLCLLYIFKKKTWQLHAMGRNTMLLFPLKNPLFQFSQFNSSLTPPKTYYLGKFIILWLLFLRDIISHAIKFMWFTVWFECFGKMPLSLDKRCKTIQIYSS